MNPEKKTPDLDQLKQMLAKSYDGTEAQDVPPMPDGLRDRIADQYGRSATTPSPSVESQKVSFFSAVAQLFATPSLRAVAAVFVLLLVATVVLKNIPSSTTGTLRGGGGNPPSILCILHGLDRAEQDAVAKSGLGQESLQTATTSADLEAALKSDRARIVINGESNLILGYFPGTDIPTIEEPLPTDPAALTAKIARIAAQLAK